MRAGPRRRSRQYNSGSLLTNLVKHSLPVLTARVIKKLKPNATQTASAVRGEGPAYAVTNQFDSKMLYKRKRAPKRVRRKARRRHRAYIARALKERSNFTNLYQKNGTLAVTVAGTQGVGSLVSGYTYNNAVGSDAIGTVFEVAQNQYNLGPNFTTKRLYLYGMSTDYTLVNSSASNTAEVDVYEFVARRDHQERLSTPSVANWFGDATAEEDKAPGALTKMSYGNLGWVPTDANTIMRYIIILNKQRYVLSAGQSCSFVRRVNFKRPVMYGIEDWEIAGSSDHNNFISLKRGVTRGIIIIYKGLPVGSAADAVQISWNAQTRYKVKVLDTEPNTNALGV